jgi:hypothetical protein
MHTHAEGLGPMVLVATTLTASLVASRRLRGVLYVLFTLGAVFPLGYLAYGLAVLEWGRDDGTVLVENYVLTPLGSAAIAGLVVLLVAMVRGPRRPALSPDAGSAPGPA